ncbi:MAG: hypothetical protein CVV23_07870 [Ignavibacteriae bacterium HGW-Ignavibacteriae-2]|nr:PaaI family thioesterase [Bacteroidota bacterium]PKL88920.1 MAG: hypothetical protein CVV23_07870 [Ignavibacteriae bacterium HGW-Ignavibacteriae-2]
MKKIRNPFIHLKDDYTCFACSPFNKNGLKMEFYDDGECVISFWKPDKNFAGWGNILHGGIQTTLMDEIGGWTIFVRLNTAGVTTNISVQFLRPVLIDGNDIKVVASVINSENNFADLKIEILDSKGKLCSIGEIKYRIFDEEKARKKFYYPGVEKFYWE